MIFRKFNFTIALVTSLLSSALITGCGGGSDSSTTNKNSKPSSIFPKTYEVSDISDQRITYNEGEKVSFRLNTQGDADKQLNYKWTVQGINSFEGQNTDAISFIAPEVDATHSYTISVKISSDNTSLSDSLGLANQSTTIIVYDTDLAENYIRNPLSIPATTLPQVNALEIENYSVNSTWLIKSEIVTNATVFETNMDIMLIKKETVYLVKNEEQSYQLQSCNESEHTSLFSTPTEDANTLECSQAISYRYYQNTNKFRIETLCDEETIYAITLEKQSDDKLISFGELVVDFDTKENISEYDKVCGAITSSNVTTIVPAQTEGEKDQLVSVSANFISFDIPYQDDRLQLVMSTENPSFGSYRLDSVFNENKLNSFSLISSKLSSLSNIQAHDGRITIINQKPYSAKGRFDVTIESDQGENETLSGEFSLNLQAN